MTIHKKPFSQGYVLRTTANYMRDSIDISLRKTGARIAEFEGVPDKSMELLSTISALYALRKIVDDFQLENREIFEG